MRLLQSLALSFYLIPLAFAQASQTAVLPSVTGYALDRTKVTLPADLAAPLNLLMLYFQRNQEPVVDAWMQALTPSSLPGVQVWQMPVSTRENGIQRWWMNASFRSSLPPSQSRHYAIPVYVDKARFRGSLHIASEQDVVLLLTDKAGRVLWRTSGPVTDDKKAALSSFVSKSGVH